MMGSIFTHGWMQAATRPAVWSLLILIAICFSTTEWAQGAPPKAGNKPVARVKPKEPTACKLVGTVRGTKLWAGDCVGVELLKGPTETPEQATPPAQKE
jgi:hypothetical protein